MAMVVSTKELPAQLVQSGRVSMAHEQLAILIGRVFLQKSALNLQVRAGRASACRCLIKVLPCPSSTCARCIHALRLPACPRVMPAGLAARVPFVRCRRSCSPPRKARFEKFGLAAAQVLSGHKETPKWFSGRPDALQAMYHAVSDYLDLDERADVLNTRFSVLTAMLDIMRDQQCTAHSEHLECAASLGPLACAVAVRT